MKNQRFVRQGAAAPDLLVYDFEEDIDYAYLQVCVYVPASTNLTM